MAELGTALLREVRDPRLQNITLMAVKMSDGLEFGRVFWLPLGVQELSPTEKKRIDRAFESATPFLRGYVAKKLKLRIVPQFRFEFDEAINRGRFMDDVIEQVRRQDAENYPHLVADSTTLEDE